MEKFTADADAIKGRHVTSDEPRSSLKFLMARRLIEAGVRCVSLTIADFDTHSDNFNRMRQVLPILDHGLHALVMDLEERGMLDDVSIVLWGEFGFRNQSESIKTYPKQPLEPPGGLGEP